MDPSPERSPGDDGAGGRPPESILARMATPVRHGLLTLSIIDTVAIGVSMWALVFINQHTTPDHLPLLVASLAASAVVPLLAPGPRHRPVVERHRRSVPGGVGRPGERGAPR